MRRIIKTLITTPVFVTVKEIYSQETKERQFIAFGDLTVERAWRESVRRFQNDRERVVGVELGDSTKHKYAMNYADFIDSAEIISDD